MTDDFPLRTRGAKKSAMPVLTIAALAAAFALGFWLLSGLSALESRARANDDRLGAQLATLDQRDAALTATQERLTRQLAELAGARRDGLLATEAEHLVRLAAQRIALMQDPQGAAALLAAADLALRDIHAADTHAARAAVARDGALLRDATAADVEVAWLRLAALPDQVERIASTQPAAAMAKRAPPATAPTASPDAFTGWDRFRHAVTSLVTIRRVDAPGTPSLTRGERELVAQHFRLLIEQAQLALLQQRAGIYRESLQQASRRLERIAAGDPLLRARVQRELAALRALEIARPLPDLGGSLLATRALATRLLPDAGTAPTGAR